MYLNLIYYLKLDQLQNNEQIEEYYNLFNITAI